MTDPLQLAVRAAQQKLRERLDLAATAMAEHAGTREIIQKTDAFLVNMCRHTSAVCDVVLPAVRTHLPSGRARVHDYVQQVRRMERAAGLAKQRMYGESHAIGRSWDDVWRSVVDESRALRLIEKDLVADLVRAPGRRPDLSLVIGSVTDGSPTRPHQHSPHTGVFSHRIRRMWAWADRFWDAAEGRIVTDRPIVPAEVQPEDLAA